MPYTCNQLDKFDRNPPWSHLQKEISSGKWVMEFTKSTKTTGEKMEVSPASPPAGTRTCSGWKRKGAMIYMINAQTSYDIPLY